MKKDNLIYIYLIRDCIDKINNYVKGMNQEEFLQSEMVQDAVIRNFEIIGEVTKKIDSMFKEKYSIVPWRQIAGMRDILIHDYSGVDIWSVWSTIKNGYPGFTISESGNY